MNAVFILGKMKSMSTWIVSFSKHSNAYQSLPVWWLFQYSHGMKENSGKLCRKKEGQERWVHGNDK